MTNFNLPRKERERLEREERLLDAAQDLMTRKGYLGLTMDELAQRTEWSKGTLFNHFRTKEDLLLGLVARSMRLRADLMERALTFQGRPRERLTAVGVADLLFTHQNPGHFQVELLVKTHSLWDKGSEERQESLMASEHRCHTTAVTIINEAIATGDLDLAPRGLTPAEVSFGLWTMFLGVHTLLCSAESLNQFGIDRPYASLFRNAQVYLDGLGWRPLYSEWDYQATYRRILDELFPDKANSGGFLPVFGL
jgi:AcrR family transcriptional regulator